MSYILGLDIGIASIGFAGMNSEDEEIKFCGVHLFETAENSKNGASLAEPRRQSRGQRRVIRRRAQRKRWLRRLLTEHGLKDISSIDLTREKGLENSVWDLRKQALERKLSDPELARVLFHIAKRRGYQSNRKDAEPNDTDGKKVLEGARGLQEAMTQSGERTIGAYLATLDKKRNGDGDYSRMVTRDLLREEVSEIFSAQRHFGQDKATEELRSNFEEIAFTQRPLQSVEKLVGTCGFEPEEKRAPKNAYTAELFVLWSKLNNLRIKTPYHGQQPLTLDEKRQIADLAHKNKKVTYKQLRKAFDLDEESRFNISYRKTSKDQDDWTKIRDGAEKSVFIELKGYHALKNALAQSEADWQAYLENNRASLDEAARILSFNDDDKILRAELDRAGFDSAEIESLQKITNFSRTVDLSLKAIRKILPFMMEGESYDKAYMMAGYDYPGNSGEKGKVVPMFEDIRNPVVARALAQTRKVINAVIRKYGLPDRIIVELAREAGKPKSERDKIERRIKDNEARRKEAKAHAEEILKKEASGEDILKYRLWKEQQGFCAYSGEYITPEILKDDTATQIDHILPYSRSWDNSYMNKVLCMSDENQSKGNQTPYEYMGDDQWDKLETFARTLPKPKAERLLRKELTRESEEGFKERNLNDTRYMSRLLKNHLEKHLDLGPGRRVETRNGALTSMLRGVWGFPDKNRRNDRHHALDAIVLASSTQSMVQKLTKWNKLDAKQGKDQPRPPKPWANFRDDVLDAIKGVFVSRMPDRKVTGPAHEDTIRAVRYADEGERRVIQRVKLKDLTPARLEDLVDRHRNKNLYNVLKQRLEEHGGKAEKAFVDPVYMPSKNPDKKGPPIHSVRIQVSEKSGLPINEGLASNGDMVRVDVFGRPNKKGVMQYYLVPIYVHHFAKGQLPNKAIVAYKDEADWVDMHEEEFLFSLYKNDLVRIRTKKETIEGYYNGTHRGTGAVNLKAHDSDPSFGKKGIRDGIGVKTLLGFDKYSVDYFGDKTRIGKEIRVGVANGSDTKSGGSEA